MKEAFFNLVDEPWIKVMMTDGREELMSLKDIYAKCSEIRALSGETPLQDNAILRLLIAISVTCIYRYDESGNESQLTGEDEAIERFRWLWEKRRFPQGYVDTYLDIWHDRFFLIGGEYPFYQVPAKYAKEIKVKVDKKNPIGSSYSLFPYRDYDKLGWVNSMSFNGEVLQSANTVSPFTNKGKDDKNRMFPGEAARWLVYYMNYADCSSKIPGKWNAGMTFTSSGANIHPTGKCLFETLMLCSVLLDANGQIYTNISPAWEKEGFTEINASPFGETMPDNIPELYTQQSRKSILHFNGEYIDGMYTAAGDRYGTANSFIEPMFAFHSDLSDKSGNTMKPNHLKPNSVGWKEYRKIFMNSFSNPSRWMNVLYEKEILPWDIHVPYIMNDIAYGSMQCTVDFTISTQIALNPKYFIDNQEIEKACIEIEHINEIASILKRFGQRIDCSYGAKRDSKGKLIAGISNRIVEEYELSAGKLIEQLLLDKIKDIEEMRKEEIKRADIIAKKTLEEINIIGFIGHGDHYIGKAEEGLNRELYLMKEKMGLMKGGDE